jgi:inhibitor of apoptosis domain-containing protein
MSRDCADLASKYTMLFHSLSNDKYFEMHKEKCRLQSFVNWPLPFICVKQLAANGFFYTGYRDVVECNFCHLRLHEWLADDDVEEQHLIFAPYCPFVKGEETTNEKFIRKKINNNNTNRN